MLESLSLSQSADWKSAAELLANGPLINASSIALIPVGNPDREALNNLASVLQTALQDKPLLVSNDLVKTRTCETQVLLVQPGPVSRSQLAQLKQSLSLQGTPVA